MAPSPLNTEPICPTVFEITPLDGQKGVSIVTCTFVQQAVHIGPCNSNRNSFSCDREVVAVVVGEVVVCDFTNREDCFSKNFCQWLWRTLCASTGDLKI